MQKWVVQIQLGSIEFANQADAIAYAIANGLSEPVMIEEEAEVETETPQPDWQGFMDALDLPPTGNGLFQAMLEANSLLALHSYQLCLSFLKGMGTEKEARTLTWLYGILCSSLQEQQQQMLSNAIAQFHIPVDINLVDINLSSVCPAEQEFQRSDALPQAGSQLDRI